VLSTAVRNSTRVRLKKR